MDTTTADLSPANPAVTSLEAAVQMRRAQLQAEESVSIPVPSWKGRLVATYRGVSWKELRSLIKDDSEASINETTTAANTLIAGCTDVFFLESDGSTQSLGTWNEAWPHLGMPQGVTTARQALMVPDGVFKRDTQLMAHFAAFQSWQQGMDEEVDEDLAGESVGAGSEN